MLGDKQQLAHALINVIENAIKFTPSGGCVQVCGEVHVEYETGVLLSVRDTGVGIASELHERVFDRFFRAKQQGAEHISGSGLGLSLVHDIVTAHRGHTWLESETGQGTIVYIWLPQHQLGQDSQE